MIFEMEQEEDGRWIAKIPTLSGVMLYDQGLKEAISKLQTLALMVLVERLENGETPSMLVSVTLNAAWVNGAVLNPSELLQHYSKLPGP